MLLLWVYFFFFFSLLQNSHCQAKLVSLFLSEADRCSNTWLSLRLLLFMVYTWSDFQYTKPVVQTLILLSNNKYFKYSSLEYGGLLSYTLYSLVNLFYIFGLLYCNTSFLIIFFNYYWLQGTEINCRKFMQKI